MSVGKIKGHVNKIGFHTLCAIAIEQLRSGSSHFVGVEGFLVFYAVHFQIRAVIHTMLNPTYGYIWTIWVVAYHTHSFKERLQ